VAKGLVFAIAQAFRPKRTIQYPEEHNPISPKHRGRLILLYDEAGTLKCETCFQCAAACPIECIDMGGVDTRQRYHVHWGPPEQYAERREESALRRSGRAVPDQAYEHFASFDLGIVDDILDAHDYDPKHMLPILEATQAAFGHLPVAAIKRISEKTGAWYAMVYGTATYYSHLRFEPPTAAGGPVGVAAQRPTDDGYLAALGASLSGGPVVSPRPAKQGRAQ
jgi:ferredoxin